MFFAPVNLECASDLGEEKEEGAPDGLLRRCGEEEGREEQLGRPRLGRGWCWQEREPRALVFLFGRGQRSLQEDQEQC